jgi:NitT/TauT family transport system ATP-binding protein
MDEPFSAVDALTRESLQDELLRLWQASGKGVLFVTHDISEAVFLADRIIVLAGSPAQIVMDEHIGVARPRDRADPALDAIGNRIAGAL